MDKVVGNIIQMFVAIVCCDVLKECSGGVCSDVPIKALRGQVWYRL